MAVMEMYRWAVAGLISAASIALPIATGAQPMQANYFCYQQKMTGQIKDLTEVCRSQPETSAKTNTPQSPTSPNNKPTEEKKIVSVDSAAKRTVEFSDLNYENGVLVGFARNKTRKPIGEVSINYVVLERESPTKWKPVYSGSTRTQANSLKAGEKTTFTATPRINGDKIVIMKAEF
jgi:hypothetical protein